MSEEELCERICQLEKELKEEKEKNQKILSDNIETFQKLFAEEISKIYISKNKIKDKIKELEKEIEEKQEYGLDCTLIYEHEVDTNGIIKCLEELLGDDTNE